MSVTEDSQMMARAAFPDPTVAYTFPPGSSPKRRTSIPSTKTRCTQAIPPLSVSSFRTFSSSSSCASLDSTIDTPGTLNCCNSNTYTLSNASQSAHCICSDICTQLSNLHLAPPPWPAPLPPSNLSLPLLSTLYSPHSRPHSSSLNDSTPGPIRNPRTNLLYDPYDIARRVRDARAILDLAALDTISIRECFSWLGDLNYYLRAPSHLKWQEIVEGVEWDENGDLVPRYSKDSDLFLSSSSETASSSSYSRSSTSSPSESEISPSSSLGSSPSLYLLPLPLSPSWCSETTAVNSESEQGSSLSGGGWVYWTEEEEEESENGGSDGRMRVG